MLLMKINEIIAHELILLPCLKYELCFAFYLIFTIILCALCIKAIYISMKIIADSLSSN